MRCSIDHDSRTELTEAGVEVGRQRGMEDIGGVVQANAKE